MALVRGFRLLHRDGSMSRIFGRRIRDKMSLERVQSQAMSYSTSDSGRDLYMKRSSSGVVTVFMNRSSGKNSFSKAFLKDFADMTASCAEDESITSLILQSTVPKVFCSGADLKERANMSDSEVEEFVSYLRSTIESFARLPFPTIAAIEGVALGGGLELALAADLRYASKSSTLGLPETALAIIPGAGGTQRLPRVIGPTKANEMIFLAQRLSGIKAAEIGLINGCVEDGLAYAEAQKVAEEIAKKGPIGIRMAKKSMKEGLDVGMVDALEIEKQCYGVVIGTEDRKEGLRAFAEKRTPVYQGK
jgi:methylglutaconyl-CoA hydratase